MNKAMTADHTFETPRLGKRIKSMLRLDFYRLFRTPIFYIMVVVSALIPVLILSMGGAENPQTGEVSIEFINVWQMIEGHSGNTTGLMDFSGMANINMLFIFAALLISIFVAHDYSSGFVKNIFSVHAKKSDYIVSKTVIGMFGGVCMILSYTLVTLIVGAFMGKSFDLGGANMGNVILCLLSKAFLMGLFVPLYLGFAVLFKQRLWVTIIATFAAGILFYPVASAAVPLDSTAVHLLISVIVAAAGFFGIGTLSTLVLNKRDLA